MNNPEARINLYNQIELLPSLSSNLVESRGDGSNGIMIIGEAPGADEDAMGLPFVGRSGKLLDNMLKQAGILPQQCYITNLVKQRPPDNRNPTQDEISHYLPIVFAEIEATAPGICILTGTVPFHAITGESSKITASRGKIYKLGAYSFMPVLHPAYVARNRSSKIGSPLWLT